MPALDEDPEGERGEPPPQRGPHSHLALPVNPEKTRQGPRMFVRFLIYIWEPEGWGFRSPEGGVIGLANHLVADPGGRCEVTTHCI